MSTGAGRSETSRNSSASDAAGAEQHHRPDLRVAPEADDRLAQAARHGLHQEAREPRLRRRAGDALAHRRRFPPQRRRVGDAEAHAAELRLVGEVGREDLQRHRPGDLARRRPPASAARRSGSAGRARPATAAHRPRPVAREDRARPARPPVPSRGARQSHQARTQSAADSGVRKAAMPASASNRSERSASGTRKAATGFGLPAARAASRASRMPATESPGRNCAEEPITARARSVSSAASSAPSAAATRSGLVPASVTSSSRAPWCGKPAASSAAPGRGVRRARLHPGDAEAVHRHRAAAARRRHDADRAMRAGQGPASGEQRRQLEQPFQGLHARDAEPAEEGVRRRVRAGQRAGVAGRELRAVGAAAELVGDHRLARGVRAAREVGEVLRPADRLQEQQDRVHLRIVHQQPGHLRRREVGLVAGADQVREADAARRAARHQRAHHRARLRRPARGGPPAVPPPPAPRSRCTRCAR